MKGTAVHTPRDAVHKGGWFVATPACLPINYSAAMRRASHANKRGLGSTEYGVLAGKPSVNRATF
jgi:hypothetical protein